MPAPSFQAPPSLASCTLDHCATVCTGSGKDRYCETTCTYTCGNGFAAKSLSHSPAMSVAAVQQALLDPSKGVFRCVYTAREGDTLASIANANGMTVAELVADNGLLLYGKGYLPAGSRFFVRCSTRQPASLADLGRIDPYGWWNQNYARWRVLPVWNRAWAWSGQDVHCYDVWTGTHYERHCFVASNVGPVYRVDVRHLPPGAWVRPYRVQQNGIYPGPRSLLSQFR